MNTGPNNRGGRFPIFSGIPMSVEKRYFYFKLLQNIFEGKYKLVSIDRCYCGSQVLEMFSVQDRFGFPFGTKICRGCGLILLSPRLSDESLPDYYDNIYWGLIYGAEPRELATGEAGEGHKIYEFIKDRLEFSNGSEPLRVVEVGCGSGLKLLELREKFAGEGRSVRLSGCDYSRKALCYARDKGIEAHEGGPEALSGKVKADLLILSHIVEHFTDLRAAFAKIQTLLQERSLVYVEVPGVADLENKSEYCYSYIYYSVMAHNYNFNLLSLRSVVEPLGFRFLCGDEYVRSLFRFEAEYHGWPDTSTNYQEVVGAVSRATLKWERWEKVRSHPVYRILRNLKNIAR